MKKTTVICMLCALALSSCSEKGWMLEWVSSTPDAPWQAMATDEEPAEEPLAGYETLRITISGEQVQTVEGFGTAFNELGWIAFSKLSEDDREHVMDELFSPEGAALTDCRIPIGGHKLSKEWYSYDEVAADFDLRYFSIAHDDSTLIPYIKQALAHNRQLRLWAATASFPSWLKRDSQLVTENLYLQTYALYVGKFADEYKLRGIDLHGVTLSTDRSYNYTPGWPKEGKQELYDVLMPEMQKRGIVLDTLQPARRTAEATPWHYLKQLVGQGTKVINAWNIALSERDTICLNDSHSVLVWVDSEEGSYRYSSDYYLLKHLSHYVKPGARVSEPESDCYQDALIFVNPDESVVVVAANQSGQPVTLLLERGGKKRWCTLPPHSFHTWLCR